MLFEKYDPLRGEMVSVIGPGGKPGTETAPSLPPDDLRRIYALMLRTRLADLKALNLQRQGRMGTYAPSLGHEACQVGTSFPAKPDDWYFPYFLERSMPSTSPVRPRGQDVVSTPSRTIKLSIRRVLPK